MIHHKGHGHPLTPAARALCRASGGDGISRKEAAAAGKTPSGKPRGKSTRSAAAKAGDARLAMMNRGVKAPSGPKLSTAAGDAKLARLNARTKPKAGPTPSGPKMRPSTPPPGSVRIKVEMMMMAGRGKVKKPRVGPLTEAFGNAAFRAASGQSSTRAPRRPRVGPLTEAFGKAAFRAAAKPRAATGRKLKRK